MITAPAFAQQDVKNVDMKKLNYLKKGGQLNGKEYFINYSSKHNRVPVTPSPTQAASSSCNCWLQRDATWQIAPFDATGGNGGPGLPPDYRNDDWSTDTITLPFNFCFYGSPKNKVFINNNGNVSIGSPYSTFTATPFPNAGFVMVAPFWGDVDTRSTSCGLVYYKLTSTYLAVQWDHVGYFDSLDDKLNTFQLVMTDGVDTILPSGQNVSFCYQDMQWTTGDASHGVNGFGGEPATVGINRGNGIDYIQIGRYDTAGIAYDGPFGNNDGISALDNQSFYLNACFSGNNVPPIINSVQVCDTLLLCVGDTLFLVAHYLSPEQNQLTTAAINPNGMSGVSVASNTSGNIATIVAQLIGQVSNIGYNSINISGTDNGVPPKTTSNLIVIHVIPSPVAGFTFAPISPVQTGSTVTFSNTSIAGISYIWDFGDGSATSSATNPVHAFSTGGTYKVTLTASDGFCTDVYQLPIVVTTCLNAAIVIPGTGCEGVPLQINYSGNASPLASYGWNFSGGTIISGSGSGPYLVNWNLAGNYTITLNVVDTGNCSSSALPISILVNALPVAAITASPVGCVGQQYAVTFAGSAVFGASYNWDFGNATVVTGSGQGPYILQWINSGNDLIQLIVSQNGCHDTVDYPVLIHAIPSSAINVATNACPDIPVSITYTGTASPSANYSWNFGGALVHSGSGPGPYAVSWVTPGSYAVSLTVTENGCASNQSTVPVTVSSLPTVNAGLDDSLCSGTVTQLGSLSQSGISYQWMPSSGLSNPNASNTTLTPTNSQLVTQINSYILTATNANGCMNSDTVAITVYPVPVVSFNVPQPQCLVGNSFQFAVNGNPIPGTQYSWNFGNKAVPAFGNQQNPTAVNFTVAGSFPVTLDASYGGCVAAPYTNSVTVFPNPSANFVASIHEGCVPLKVLFTNTSTGNNGAYHWNFSDGLEDTSATPVHVYMSDGIYTIALIVTSLNGCTDVIAYPGMVTVHAKPVAAFEPSPEVAPVWSPLISFENYSSDAIYYFWEFGDGETSAEQYPSHIYADTGMYEVTLYVSTLFGCLDTIKGLVRVEYDFTFYVPNVFTPNGDGVNDFFRGYGTFIKTYEMYIFNRWGDIIYSTNDNNKPWDGKVDQVVQNDVYVYKIMVTDSKDIPHEYIGRVTLLR